MIFNYKWREFGREITLLKRHWYIVPSLIVILQYISISECSCVSLCVLGVALFIPESNGKFEVQTKY